MNSSAEPTWSGPGEAMAPIDGDLGDLDNLFEFGDIGLGTAMDPSPYGDHLQAHENHPQSPFDEMSEGKGLSGTTSHDFAGHDHFHLSQHVEQSQQFNGHVPTSNPYTSQSMYQPSMQHPYQTSQPFQFQGQSGFPTNQQVPPTPNSFEMHGEAGRFLQSQLDSHQRAILEQRHQMRKEDARQAAMQSGLPLDLNQIAFTPMASPAGTPQYNVPPEFTIPGAYFSPLTSPMLHAQNGQAVTQAHQQGYYTNPSTAPTSNATSPLDPHGDVDMLADEMSLSESAHSQTRKSNRRKAPTPRSAGPLARVKQSPMQKATKRKSGSMLSSMVPSKDMEAIIESQRPGSIQPGSAGLSMPPTFRNDSSENGSISPEPLSEALMRPPPRPSSSLAQSPAMAGQQQDKSGQTSGKAATPKSILSMRGGNQAGSHTSGDQAGTHGIEDQPALEELELPAALAGEDTVQRMSLPQLNTQIQPVSIENTPRSTARKTPKLGMMSTPSSARPGSAVQSPLLPGSPMTASTPGALLRDKRADSKGPKAGKKRGSISASGTILVSPALRPRISPSIKPLLPEGAVHSPTHALLLASKSNYQNLLEGNHLPGVNYPDSLSTGLTSKRTSHKVAEQGRRNRINEALKEMQSLLPKLASGKAGKDASNSDGSPDAVDPETKESKDDAAKSNSSKAATVESANEYIRMLQKENAALLQAKQEYEELRKMHGEPSSDSPVSTGAPSTKLESVSSPEAS